MGTSNHLIHYLNAINDDEPMTNKRASALSTHFMAAMSGYRRISGDVVPGRPRRLSRRTRDMQLRGRAHAPPGASGVLHELRHAMQDREDNWALGPTQM